MNKRITSIVLCLVLLVSLMAAAVPVAAESTVAFTMKADKTGQVWVIPLPTLFPSAPSL